MRKFKIIFLAIQILTLFFLPVVYAEKLSDRVKEFTLSNGMRFFIYERHHSPTFAGMIMVKVGSIDERKGETGLAHFFEHMAFKGTTVIGTNDYNKEKVLLEEIDKIGQEMATEYFSLEKAVIPVPYQARDKIQSGIQKKIDSLKKKMSELQAEHKKYVVKEEFSKIYVENGGRYLNASTGYDTTQYFVMLPSNRIELWFMMESERFKYPVLREFYQERDVVAEEKRGRDNDPDSLLWQEFSNISFVLNPYRNPIIGYMNDIQQYNGLKAKNFYNTFYVPNNMVAALVGDIKLDDAKKLAEKYFGDISKSQEPPRQEFVEPEQRAEKRAIIRYDAEPQIIIGYRMPMYSDRENIILDLISSVLSAGESSRLKREIVTNKKLAVNVGCWTNTPGTRFNSLFIIEGLPRHPHTIEELENAIYEHLEKLKTEPVLKYEIEKAINQEEASLYQSSSYAENVFIAMRILRNVISCNDIDNEFKRVEIMKSITPEEIMNVAKKYFTESNRIVGIIQKDKK
jgi:predicted Zn-dependent peptidase